MFLNNADVYSKDTLPKELAEDEQIRKASELLEVMYLDEKEREYYEAQQKRYLDEMSRIQEAVEEAELKKQIEIAENLISLKSENAFIVKATGLSLKQIESLRAKEKTGANKN